MRPKPTKPDCPNHEAWLGYMIRNLFIIGIIICIVLSISILIISVLVFIGATIGRAGFAGYGGFSANELSLYSSISIIINSWIIYKISKIMDND